MSQLPGGTYTLCDYKYFLRVPDNYHLEYDGHYYSVLYTYRGQPAILKATMSEIRICDQNNRLICRHQRSYKPFPRYITDDSHMRTEHLYYKEVNAHDGAYYRRWASVYGDEMSSLIDRVLRSFKHEEQGYKSCAGMAPVAEAVSERYGEEFVSRYLFPFSRGLSDPKSTLVTISAAMVGSVIVILCLRGIARREGNEDRLRLFLRGGGGTERLFTPALIVAIVLTAGMTAIVTVALVKKSLYAC